MESKGVIEWPCVMTHSCGTLTISRIRMGMHSTTSIMSTTMHVAPASIAQPPEYHHAISDGFRVSFIARTSGEIYEHSVGDTDVPELCSGDISIGANAFMKLIQEKQETILIAHNKTIVSWKIQLASTLTCMIRLDLDRTIATKGSMEVLEVRLRSHATRITDLELQVTDLRNSMSHILEVLMAQVVGTKGHLLIAELGLAGGKISNKFTILPCEAQSGISHVWTALPHPADINACAILRSLFSAGLDPNMRNIAPDQMGGIDEYVTNGKAVSRNETILHYYVMRLCQWNAEVGGTYTAKIFAELIQHGADPRLVDNRGDNVVAWFRRSEKILHTRFAHNPTDLNTAKQILTDVRTILGS